MWIRKLWSPTRLAAGVCCADDGGDGGGGGSSGDGAGASGSGAVDGAAGGAGAAGAAAKIAGAAASDLEKELQHARERHVELDRKHRETQDELRQLRASLKAAAESGEPDALAKLGIDAHKVGTKLFGADATPKKEEPPEYVQQLQRKQAEIEGELRRTEEESHRRSARDFYRGHLLDEAMLEKAPLLARFVRTTTGREGAPDRLLAKALEIYNSERMPASMDRLIGEVEKAMVSEGESMLPLYKEHPTLKEKFWGVAKPARGKQPTGKDSDDGTTVDTSKMSRQELLLYNIEQAKKAAAREAKVLGG